MTHAQQMRFEAFVDATIEDERDWIAFIAFENAVREVTATAAIVTPDHRDAAAREEAALLGPIGDMLYRVLPHVGLAAIVARVYGIGYALRYGVIPTAATALDDVLDAEALHALADRGDAADERARNKRFTASRPQ
jgi:hypothetical protein